jgi:hypothetical protein
LLLANKADPNERDNSGHTPLDLAKSQAQPGPGQLIIGPAGASSGSLTLGQTITSINYQSVEPGAPTPTPEQPSKPKTMADVLRQHGALDDLPHLDQIGVRRTAAGYSDTAFTKSPQDWSQFSLLELLAGQCGFLATSANTGGSDSDTYYAKAFFNTYKRLPYPDLQHLHISRPAPDLKHWQDQVVDLSPVLASGDCAKDVRLRWGDVVEIPEADHPLNASWPGFSKEELANLKKCLTRQVEIVVKGQATKITLAPRISNFDGQEGLSLAGRIGPRGFNGDTRELIITAQTPFWLKPVLLQTKLVLISSDLSRVKVTRRDPATGQQLEWVVDCSKSDSAPDLWLQDGDRIEVPEKM